MPDYPSDIIAYTEYDYAEQFSFAFGINGLAGAVYFKSGWKKNRLSIQIYTSFEPVLGFSPGYRPTLGRQKQKGMKKRKSLLLFLPCMIGFSVSGTGTGFT